MEEKSKMKVVKENTPEVRKLTYEELENAAHQLSEQSRQLYMQNKKLNEILQEADLSNFYERLKWLWTVVTSDTPYITEDFKNRCGIEFQVLMTKHEQSPKEKEGE